MLPDAVLGWLYVVGAVILYGSFAVPIKSQRVVSAGVNPLVFQSFKTICVFLTSIPFALALHLEFTWWGVLSGLFWVPASVAIVFCVPLIGIAASIGICNSLIVVVSFVWGVFVFGDQVKSIWGTAGFLLLLIASVIGMAFASRPRQKKDETPPAPLPPSVGDEEEHLYRAKVQNGEGRGGLDPDSETTPLVSELQQPGDEQSDTKPQSVLSINDAKENKRQTRIICGRHVSLVALGYMGAFFNGLYGGSVSAPLGLAKKTGAPVSGLQYVFSFGVGSLLVNAIFMLGYVAYKWGVRREQIVSRHQLKTIAGPAIVAGVLWSGGNLCSTFAVIYLGQAIGYSACQANVVINGLWAIFLYREMRGVNMLIWFFFAATAVGAIYGLSTMRG